MTNFWETLDQLEFDNEASVEHYLIQPMLAALGYELTDISPKHPVIFREGRVGRKPEADFVIFYGESRSKDASLITIEAKKPNEKLDDAKLQCESYAFNLRTPFTILTNGIEIEIWQLQVSWESTLLLRERVKDIARSQGKIESLISKDSAYNYAKSLEFKNFSEKNQDFSIYENSVLKRYIKSIYAIERRLSKAGETQQSFFSTLNLLNDFPQGAIILGSSGYGKTTIHNSLLLKAIEERQSNSDLKLAIDIYLPDLVHNKSSIFDFMTKRIKAHQPTFSESQLIEILRTKGFIFFFDAFDRIQEDDQKPIISEIINLQRDYPLIQIFIFSRAIATPRLGLEILIVESLSDDEKSKFIDSTFHKNNEFSNQPTNFIYLIPDILRNFCSHPLLLELVINFWLSNRFISTDLINLFQNWLETTLIIDEHNLANSLYLEEALSLISYETIKSPISKMDIFKIFKENNFSASLFNELVRLDSINVKGDSIDIKHEALADYLRVKKITSIKNELEIENLINNMQLKAGSLFPILLVSMLPTFELQKKLWQRLSHLDIDLYINILRYKSDHSKKIKNLNNVTSFVLEEIIDGIELPLKSFLPQLEDIIINDITKNRYENLAISGNLSKDLSWITYAIHPQEENKDRVNIRNLPLYFNKHGISLKPPKYSLDSGRFIGSEYLLNRLFKVIESRKIIGGITYRMDRLISRLRYINHDYVIKTKPFESFENLISKLTPYDGQYVPITYNRDDSYFTVSDLILDIDYLKKNGFNSLDSWWLRLGYKSDLRIHDEKIITDILIETFNRIQLIYKEIVENSFYSIRELFGFYMALPVKWEVYVNEGSFHNFSISYSWFPVDSWKDVSTEVYFSKSPTYLHSQKDKDLIKALKQLGRDKAQSYSNNTSSSIFFHFDGVQLFSGKVNGETPALKEACDLIENDIKRIFGYIATGIIR